MRFAIANVCNALVRTALASSTWGGICAIRILDSAKAALYSSYITSSCALGGTVVVPQ